MEYRKILYTVKDNIAKIILNEPEKMNRLTDEMDREIVNALKASETNNEVRVIIITGAGDKAFCAGAALDEFVKTDRSSSEAKQSAENYIEIPRTFSRLRKVSIAMVNGYALAGGCGLVMYPTFAIASETARFGLTEINVGIWSMMVSGTLFRLVNTRKALELLCTGELIDAHEAEEIGLINKAVPPGDLEKEVMNLAEKIKSKSAAALSLGLDAYYTTMDMEYQKALSYLTESSAFITLTRDAKEGFKAFLEKRKPQWTHRL
jgi:enoyl-CoA hydratase/carnithine racemase